MVNDLKDIIKDFKNLTSKIQTDNSYVKQHLKDKKLMLEACQKEYQKIYFEPENFKKKFQQLEEQFKQQQQQQQQWQQQCLIKKLPQCIKNKKRCFITDNSEDENIDDCENENDDDDYDDDDDNTEVEYIKEIYKTNI